MVEAMRDDGIAAYRTLLARRWERALVLAVSTGVIVGFPGEGEADSEAIAAFLEDARDNDPFESSPCEGTHAPAHTLQATLA